MTSLQVDNVRLVDRYNLRKPIVGTLYLTATHLIFVDPAGKKETWVLHMHISCADKLPLTTSGCPLQIRCKNFLNITFVFPRERDCHDILTSLQTLYQPVMWVLYRPGGSSTSQMGPLTAKWVLYQPARWVLYQPGGSSTSQVGPLEQVGPRVSQMSLLPARWVFYQPGGSSKSQVGPLPAKWVLYQTVGCSISQPRRPPDSQVGPPTARWILYEPAELSELYAFHYISPDIPDRQHGWSLFDLQSEYLRMGVSSDKWTLTNINREYEVSRCEHMAMKCVLGTHGCERMV
ncbi:hypothetical protein NP493_253g03028 [Ridgeia piscesae]|uniref:Myotubularin phosphatase domain-containing protein n=1 Tax=Ridgeia piscesae TaxID=27915 RepID=A0AAD9NYH7_RIDPI|nr:hypothetical protein NP493_253g03028 [Ridgeia piscesae]